MPNSPEIITSKDSELRKENLISNVDSVDNEPIPREIKSWMQKVEDLSSLNNQVSDSSGQPLLSTSAPVSPKITLPITRSTFIKGFQKAVTDAGRWLSVFFFRFIKLKKGNVVFKDAHE